MSVEELKTLKDCYMSDGRNYEQKIREEAIKWIKKLNYIAENEIGKAKYCTAELMLNDNYKSDDISKRKLELVQIPYGQDDFYGAVKILTHFFNVSEGDLK